MAGCNCEGCGRRERLITSSENGYHHGECHHCGGEGVNHHDGYGWWNDDLKKIILALVLLIAACVTEKSFELKVWQLLLIFLVPYFVAGWETLKEAARSLSRGAALDETFLMSIATIGSLAIGFFPGVEPEFTEAVFVMLFYQLGEYFEGMAEGKSRRSISHLMDIRPDSANVERGGELLCVDPSEVDVGEIVVVRPGDKVPMDGVIVEGRSGLDTVALTGESVPRNVEEGDSVVSGCVNISGVLRVRVEKVYNDSTVARILDLVENAAEHKSKSEGFITRFAKVYTPIVVACAAVLAFIPPVLWGNFAGWLYRACIFLVVSCPCALVISVPLAFFGGLGGASRKGILVKGSNWLEALARLDTVVMDKTGTLTKGVFQVVAVHPEIIDETELLHMAAHVERYSTHPIAQSLREAFPQEHDGCIVEEVEEIAGCGVRARVNGKIVCVGNSRLMESVGAAWHPCGSHHGSVVHVSIDGIYMGHVVISDRIREDSPVAVSGLRSLGVKRIAMLTGDSERTGEAVALELGLDEWHCELLPADKVEELERMMQAHHGRGTLAFVGDGINDAPVLARADIGVAMGGLGADAAMEAADVVLMDDKPSKLPLAIQVARKTVRIARENTVFALGIKFAVLLLALFGIASMWLAVFADVGVCLLAILNSMRSLSIKSRKFA